MAKLYFKFGAMGSSKTAQALMTRFNYVEKGMSVLLMKPATDNRDDHYDEEGNLRTVAKSRMGLQEDAVPVTDDQSIVELYHSLRDDKGEKYDVIICDECQFLTPHQVDEMKDLADLEDVPVLCFGLRSDFMTLMFPGSKRLFEIADSITEIKSVCSCGRKATINARLDANGTIVTEGSQVLIGGNDRYVGVCYKCYRRMIAERDAAAAQG